MTRAMVVVAVLAVVALAAPIAIAETVSPAAPPRLHTVHLTARYSHWSVSHVQVEAGTILHFVARNDDPIDHELIVGDQALQDRHERGTEAHHPPRPGEVSIAAGTTAETALTFSRPGTYFFGCHVPGHWAYGMHGTITVVP